MKYFCHKTSEVQTVNVGEGTFVWQFVVILKNAIIGSNCNINSHVFIENDVVIGDNVTIKSGVQIWDGLNIENDVFIGPNVTFTNDILPRSKRYPKEFSKTLIKKGASIGANATILAGCIIQEYAMIGAGSVVTKNVGRNELWLGNAARHCGYVTNEGIVLDMKFRDNKSGDVYNWGVSKKLIKK